MSHLVNIKRPTVAFIKLIEAVGIILGIPLSYEKSAYKVPVPSNYDDTVKRIAENFDEIFNHLILLRSCDISNDVAKHLYAKIEEPGFNYEDVVNQGGLDTRELFNSVIYILLQLQSDKLRIPLTNTNIFVAVNGSRSSYVALDAAAHVHSHGVLTVGAITAGDSVLRGRSDVLLHLAADIDRRCRLQYEKKSYLYRVNNINVETGSEIVPMVEEEIKKQNCSVLIVGVETNSSVDSGLEMVTSWAAEQVEGMTVVLAKSCCRVLPFGESRMPRTLQVCVKHLHEMEYVFSKCLQLMRPGDSVVLVTIVDPSTLTHGKQNEEADAAALRASKVAALPKSTTPTFKATSRRPSVDMLENRILPHADTRFDIGRKPGMWVSEEYHPSSRLQQMVPGPGGSKIPSRKGQPLPLRMQQNESSTAQESSREELHSFHSGDRGDNSGPIFDMNMRPASPNRPSSPEAPNCLLLAEEQCAMKKLLQDFDAEMQQLIAASQVTGSVRIEQYGKVPKTAGRIIGEIANEENADFLILRRGKHARNLSKECVKSVMCSVVLVD